MCPAPRLSPDPDVEWEAYIAKRRKQYIKALNTAPQQFRNNPVPEHYTKFWEFFLPDDFLMCPLLGRTIPTKTWELWE
jgi:hypothetical protein